MNQIVHLKIKPWDGAIKIESILQLEKGDLVIIDSEEGAEHAIVEKIEKIRENDLPKAPSGASMPRLKIARKASLSDLNTIKEHRKKEQEALFICRDEVKKKEIPMKVIGAAYSFDGGSITFAFIADGRVDFRDLVKTLSKKFQRSIRLHQIGARDEARNSIGYGICGRELCCIRFKENLPSISSEMAKAQQIVRRGSERISGLCGRLMCCLAYEADQYREILEKMPGVGSAVETPEGKGIVKEVNALTGKIKVELENKKIIQILAEGL